jgi:uncharacterized ion transporter superfamily protein YfcC
LKPTPPKESFFDVALLFTILISIALVIIESVPPINSQHRSLLRILEWVITIIFSIEYILRILKVKKHKYSIEYLLGHCHHDHCWLWRDISPQTPLGQFLASAVMIVGYAIIAVPTGIVTAEMMKPTKSSNTQVCPHCLHDKHESDAVFCKKCGGKLN